MKTYYSHRKYWLAPLFLAGFALIILIAMLLWNNLMTGIFSLPVLTYWQVAGLLILVRIFFGFGGHRHGFAPRRAPLHDKWHHMTPEEREEFVKKIRSRKHFWGEPCPEGNDREIKNEKQD